MTTLPGHLTSPTAGPLLRRGAPVVVNDIAQRFVLDLRHDLAYVDAWDGPRGWGLGLVALDLTDPAGMDIAARWLARHHGLTVGATAPVWQRIKGMDPSTIWSLSVRSDIDMDASPTVQVDQRGFVEPGAFPESPIANVVPGISTVTDPAEALRLACLAAVAR